MIINVMFFVMLYCIYSTGEVQHASLKASIWSKTEEALNFGWSMLTTCKRKYLNTFQDYIPKRWSSFRCFLISICVIFCLIVGYDGRVIPVILELLCIDDFKIPADLFF